MLPGCGLLVHPRASLLACLPCGQRPRAQKKGPRNLSEGPCVSIVRGWPSSVRKGVSPCPPPRASARTGAECDVSGLLGHLRFPPVGDVAREDSRRLLRGRYFLRGPARGRRGGERVDGTAARGRPRGSSASTKEPPPARSRTGAVPSGAPCAVRTRDLGIRSPLLYPAGLREQNVVQQPILAQAWRHAAVSLVGAMREGPATTPPRPTAPRRALATRCDGPSRGRAPRTRR